MSIKNAVKQLSAVLAAIVAVVFATTPGQAVFTRQGSPQTVSASATVGGTPTISLTGVAVKNIAGDATAGALSWTGTAAGTAWKLADQYIQMTSNINTGPGGIQIYMDNTTSSPAFTGVLDGNHPTPAGLVDNTDTTQKLPTAWMASTNTYAAANAALTPIDPSAPTGFNWFFHEDDKQVGGAGNNSTTWANGTAYATVYAAPGTTFTDGGPATATGGVHYASGLFNGNQQFGPFTNGVAVTNIYTEANFSSALVGRTYNTTKLILEAYSL